MVKRHVAKLENLPLIYDETNIIAALTDHLFEPPPLKANEPIPPAATPTG